MPLRLRKNLSDGAKYHQFTCDAIKDYLYIKLKGMKKILGFFAGKMNIPCSPFYGKTFIEGWFIGAGIRAWHRQFTILRRKKSKNE